MKLAIIGGGQMAEAVIAGLCKSGQVSPRDIYVSDHKEERIDELKKRYGIQGSVGAEGFLPRADTVLFAVKPAAMQLAMQETRAHIAQDACIISIAAGVSIRSIKEVYPSNPTARVMPNTPLIVGEGMTVFAVSKEETPADTERLRANVERIFSSAGRLQELTEPLIDVATGLSGSGPAYAFLIIEALADGATALGLKKQDALRMAAQTLLGASKLVLETGTHPAVLKDSVTSPAGTTAAGLAVLEEGALRAALQKAVKAAAARAAEIGK
ncbi:pyrroline-5-carboxylate reductase [Selenomonas sp. TAMA-11512]|nr:pyrroline-5-carboxylate reductase [Selenomonas sp. TAMA-11512]